MFEDLGKKFEIFKDADDLSLKASTSYYPDGLFSISELLMLHRVHIAHLRLDAECDFEHACDVLKLIGWDEKGVAVILPQSDVDEIVQAVVRL
jgi:hypothetical protein